MITVTLLINPSHPAYFSLSSYDDRCDLMDFICSWGGGDAHISKGMLFNGEGTQIGTIDGIEDEEDFNQRYKRCIIRL